MHHVHHYFKLKLKTAGKVLRKRITVKYFVTKRKREHKTMNVISLINYKYSLMKDYEVLAVKGTKKLASVVILALKCTTSQTSFDLK